jgi:hypothetical protein
MGSDHGIDPFQVFFNRVCLPVLIIAAVLIGIRNKRISTTEILIYINGLLPLSYMYTVKLTDRDHFVTEAIFFLIVPGIIHFQYFRKALSKFSVLDFVFACIPLFYFSVLGSVLLFLTLFKETGTDEVAGFAGLSFGVILTAVTIFLYYRIWKRSRQ